MLYRLMCVKPKRETDRTFFLYDVYSFQPSNRLIVVTVQQWLWIIRHADFNLFIFFLAKQPRACHFTRERFFWKAWKKLDFRSFITLFGSLDRIFSARKSLHFINHYRGYLNQKASLLPEYLAFVLKSAKKVDEKCLKYRKTSNNILRLIYALAI